MANRLREQSRYVGGGNTAGAVPGPVKARRLSVSIVKVVSGKDLRPSGRHGLSSVRSGVADASRGERLIPSNLSGESDQGLAPRLGFGYAQIHVSLAEEVREPSRPARGVFEGLSRMH